MKFAKELEHHLVPEWRAKYLDYKVGKKKIKAIQRALRNAQSSTPRTPLRRGNAPLYTPEDVAPQYSYLNRETQNLHDASQRPPSQGQEPAIIPPPPPPAATAPSPIVSRDFARTPSNKGSNTKNTTTSSGYLTPLHRARSRPTPSNSTEALETSPLIYHNDHRTASSDPANTTYSDNNNTRGLTRYGSIIGSPPRHSSPSLMGRGPPSLDLPGPALRTQSQKSSSNLRLEVSPDDVGKLERKKRNKDGKKSPSPGGTGRKNTITHRTPLSMRHRSIFHPIRMNSSPHINTSGDAKRPMIKRLFSLGAANTSQPGEFPMAAYKDVDVRQGEFFNFLDLELEKVEEFYKSKEDDATKRLEVLRQQLHIMRDRRVEEILQARAHSVSLKHPHDGENGKDEGRNGSIVSKAGPLLDKVGGAIERARQGNIGRRSKALETLTTGGPIPSNDDDDETQENWNRDYVRKIKHSNVPYHTARRKLKLAIQEYYRGLELLKSYALLNQKAFRKINKKYDKAVNARPSLRYMNEKVNTAYFVTSDVVDGHIRMVEDLYARYFEGGNHKVAAGKLRAKTSRSADYTSVVFRNGLYLATGLVFAVEGLVYAGQIIEGSDDGFLSTNASFLLQIYAGYFLMLLLMLFFILDCRLWNKARVNYAFIFEFDNRSLLDWHELAELPCFFLFLLGFFLWINFSQYGTASMFIYYPVILVGLTFIILFNPLPILYPRTRQWFLTANWRLFFSGLYPVEFRDFFLGDMFCSFTYSMGNIELFFCLYAHLTYDDLNFSNPSQCNSSHSRVLGFFTTLPGIWRALQCLRRYKDTGNAFPHLANFGKYLATICFYMSLSLWRVDHTFQMKAVFIFFATVNAVYCSIWDLVMDWSLLDPYSHPRLLRDHLAFKSTWIYYAAMVLDPILRFNWIFYAIYGTEIQHSAILSFFVAFSEVCRRGIWTIFRVENEHCTNVGRFRASRDVPLPYKIKKSHEERVAELGGVGTGGPDQTYVDAETDEDEEMAAREEEQRRQGVSISPSLSRSRSTGVDMLHRHRTSDSEATIRLRQQRHGAMAQASPMLRTMSYVGNLLHTAHAQDFERKRKADEVADVGSRHKRKGDDSDTDLDDEDEGTDREEEEEGETEEELDALEEGRAMKDLEAASEVADAGEGSSSEGSASKAKGHGFSFKPKRQPVDDDDVEAQRHTTSDEDGPPLSPRSSTPVPSRGRLTQSEENVVEQAEDTKGKKGQKED